MSTAYVDISSHQAAAGPINLAAYRDAGHTDLMLKATEGTGYAWPAMQALARQWHGYGPGFRVGYYHWLYGNLSGLAQFSWFWLQVAPVYRPGDWLMVDYEDVDGSRWVPDVTRCTALREFGTLAEAHGTTHYYAPDWYLGDKPATVAWLKQGNRPVVASDYSHDPPGNRFGLNQVAHQRTDRALVAGFAGPVDYNRWLTAAGPGVETASSGTATEITIGQPAATTLEGPVFHLIRNVKTGAVRAVGPNFWRSLNGKTPEETMHNVAMARALPTCLSPHVQDVSDAGMQWEHDFYITGKVA